MATRVAGLSDEVLKAAFCRIEGRDPGRRSRGDLVAWLASKPDDEFTSTAIELARKQPPPPHDRDKGMLHMSKYSRRRIAKRREFLEIDGVALALASLEGPGFHNMVANLNESNSTDF